MICKAYLQWQLPISWRKQNGRFPQVMLFLTLLTLLAIVAALTYGDYPVSWQDVIKSLLMLPTVDPESPWVVHTLRLPRVLLGWLVGIALGVSGTILQGLTRNSLADPGIVGVNAGAGLTAVTLIILFPNAQLALPLAAFGGGLGVAMLLYLLAGTQGNSPLRLILTGVALGAITSAFTTLLLTFGRINQVTQALVWLVGSVSGKSWEHVWPLLPWIVVLIPLAMQRSRSLNALQLGSDVARGLGSRVEWERAGLLLISVALAAAAVATAGTIGFVGLISPHMGRRLVSSDHESLIPVTALIGGLLVICADLIGRSVFSPTEIPCGIMTAVLGAPYFLFLLYWSRKK